MKGKLAMLVAVFMVIPMMTLSARTSAEVKSYSFKNFSGIETGIENRSSWKSWIDRWGTVDVMINVVKSSRYKVEVSVPDPEYNDAVSVEKNGSVLKITSKMIKCKGKNRPEVMVNVHTPSLEYIDLEGVAKMNVEGTFTSENVDISLGGATSLSGYTAEAEYVTVDISGASSVNDMDLSASVKCSFSLSGAGEVRGLAIKASRLDIDASGAASIRTADLSAETLNLDASGAANLSVASVSFETAVMSLSGGTSYSMKGFISEAKAGLSGAAKLEFSSTEKGESLTLECSGASAAYFAEAPYRDVTVSAYGASKASVNATNMLKTDISRTSSLDYYGNPKTVIHESENIRAH